MGRILPADNCMEKKSGCIVQERNLTHTHKGMYRTHFHFQRAPKNGHELIIDLIER
jgi:hypothetical protein